MTTEVKLTQASSPYSFAPSEEKDGVTIVKGFAVHVGTFNDITIQKEELERSVSSLVGMPLLKNHDNNIDVVIGKIIDAECQMDPDNGEYGIAYTAEVDSQEEDLIRKMRLEFIGSVSVGFRCEHICSICGQPVFSCEHWFWDEGFQILARNIVFHELSIVAVPADLDATVKINFANDTDKLKFDKLAQIKKERRQNMSDNFESKYNDIVEKFNNFKMEKVDEINTMKEEFKATKEQLEADKADKVEEVIGLKSEIETLKQEKESLKEKVDKYEESFKQMEEEKLSVLREKVEKLNAEVNGGYTKEEIDSLEEATLNRIAQSFENISQHMVKIHEPHNEEPEQYKQGEGNQENVNLAQSLTGTLKGIRGF